MIKEQLEQYLLIHYDVYKSVKAYEMLDGFHISAHTIAVQQSIVLTEELYDNDGGRMACQVFEHNVVNNLLYVFKKYHSSKLIIRVPLDIRIEASGVDTLEGMTTLTYRARMRLGSNNTDLMNELDALFGKKEGDPTPVSDELLNGYS